MKTQRLLQPGLHLMGRLRLRTKIILMLLVLGVPCLALLALNQGDRRSAWLATSLELDGLAVAHAATGTAAELRALRAAVARAGTEATPSGAAPSLAAAALRERVDALEAAIGTHTRLALQDEWAAARRHLDEALSTAVANPERAAAVLGNAERAMHALLSQATHASGIDLEADPAIFYRQQMAFDRLERLADALADVQVDALAVHGRDAAATATLAAAHERQLARLASQLTVGSQSLTAPAQGQPASSFSQQRRLDDLRLRLQQMAQGAAPAAVIEAAAHAAEAVQSQQREMLATMAHDLDARRQHLAWSALAQGSLALLAFLLAAYLATAWYHAMNDGLNDLGRGVAAVGHGDLTQRIDVRGHDEVAGIATVIEQNHQRLSQIVAHIRSSAVRVAGAGEAMADASQALADRTEEQASSVQQAARVFDRLREEVERNAQAAGEVDEITTRLCRQAEEGSAAMHESVQHMGRLEASAARMAEIITTIDDIAFQTNVLALNAAVEAAKAGEAGRSFAVVATEVRQLAQRCGTAAGEIRNLIRESVDEVGTSVTHIHGVGNTLDQLVHGVQEVSKRLSTIAESCGHQASGLDEVMQGVTQLESITRQNQHMGEESKRSAHTLADRARALAEGVAGMRLRQGSADEALAITRAAHELVKRVGLDQARATFYERGSRFLNRDLYVFVLDREGAYVLHGAKPEVEGRHAQALVGVHGERFRESVWEAASQPGGGWAEYQMLDASTGQIHPKESFVMPLDENLLIGCGVYLTMPTRSPGATAEPVAAAAQPAAMPALSLTPAA